MCVSQVISINLFIEQLNTDIKSNLTYYAPLYIYNTLNNNNNNNNNLQTELMSLMYIVNLNSAVHF